MLRAVLQMENVIQTEHLYVTDGKSINIYLLEQLYKSYVTDGKSVSATD